MRAQKPISPVGTSAVAERRRPVLPPALRGESTDYTKFLILCSPRTGSNMLVSLLASNPATLSMAELFDHRTVYFSVQVENRGLKNGDEAWLQVKRENPTQFLNCIFGSYSNTIRAVGFKFFYHHDISACGRGVVWDALVGMRDLRIVHLRRRNTLRALVSLEIAKSTQRFVTFTEGAEMVRVKLEMDTILHALQSTAQSEHEQRVLWDSHDLHEVWFEDLAMNPIAVTRAVEHFLDVPVGPEPTTPLFRQNPRSISDMVANYSDLCNTLTGTPFEWMLVGH